MTDTFAVPMNDTVDDMVEVLLECDADLDDPAECLTVLTEAGFTTSAINVFMDDAIEEAKDQHLFYD